MGTMITVGAPARAAADDAAEPVVRAASGDWGLFFRVAGLDALALGNNERDVGGLRLVQVGAKVVLSEELMIPFYFGTGLRSISEDGEDQSQSDFGIDLGVGVEWHFRTWRRISPFVGAHLGFGLVDPSGDENTNYGFGIGPSIGVEYYVADRLSLMAQYMLVFQLDSREQPGLGAGTLQTVQLSTLAGGALNLTFYF
ncbi:hypothetical protein L6R52_05130 [Myxococcota bacterium]|nr:hypothetical protein [Myxococcota bacterium]